MKVLKSATEMCWTYFQSEGKNIFFPKLGILAQAAQAKGKKH